MFEFLKCGFFYQIPSETELTGCEVGEWGHQVAVVSYKPAIKVRKTQEALQLLAGSGSSQLPLLNYKPQEIYRRYMEFTFFRFHI